MQVNMTFCTWIIAQATLAQGDKNILRGIYAGELCRSAPSVVVIVDRFSDHLLAVSWPFGLRLDAAWVGRSGLAGSPVRQVCSGGLQPIVDAFDRATDIELGIWLFLGSDLISSF